MIMSDVEQMEKLIEHAKRGTYGPGPQKNPERYLKRLLPILWEDYERAKAGDQGGNMRTVYVVLDAEGLIQGVCSTRELGEAVIARLEDEPRIIGGIPHPRLLKTVLMETLEDAR